MKLLQITTSTAKAQVTTQTLYASVIIISASAGNFLGDDTVTTATGVPLSATAGLVITSQAPRGIPLNSLWIIGAAGTANILYEPSA